MSNKSFQVVFPSTGHCGSTYIAKVAQEYDISISHEFAYRGERWSTKNERDPREILAKGAIAESSGFMPPFLRDQFCRDAKCVHLIREPIRVVRSWALSHYGHGHGGFHSSWLDVYDLWPYKNVELFQMPAPCRDHTWLCGMYVQWNKLIEQLRPDAVRYKVERGPEFISMLGWAELDGRHKTDATCSIKVDPQQRFDMVVTDKQVLDDFMEMTERYGYQTRKVKENGENPNERCVSEGGAS